MASLAVMPPHEHTPPPVQVDLVAEAKSIQINSESGYLLACDHVKKIALLKQSALDKFEPMREKAYAAYQEILKQKKAVIEPLEDAERVLRSGIGRWLAEQEEIRRAEERRLREEQEAAHAVTVEAQLEELDRTGASAEEVRAVAEQPMIAPAPYVAPAAPKVSGVSARETWTAEVTDLMALVKAVAAGTVPLIAIEANTAYLGQMARANKQLLNIPGVRAVRSVGAAIRRS